MTPRFKPTLGATTIGPTIPVNDIHTGIQSVGRYTGAPVTIIALQGCDVRCPWCNVPEMWQLHTEPNPLWKRPLKRWLELTAGQIVEAVGRFRQRRVVITGGEPLMHDIDALVDGLQRAGYAVQLETSGTKAVNALHPQVFLTTSPKLDAGVLTATLARSNEIVFPVTRLDSLKRLQLEVVPFLKRFTPVYLHVIGSGVLASKAAAAAFAHDYFLVQA